MPIKKCNRHRYPPNWAAISRHIRFVRARGKCEVCGAAHGKPHPITGSKVVLTVAHLDHCPENCEDKNLKAMCQKCHNNYDKEHRKETRLAGQRQLR
jgi:hypothetical protein